MAATITAVVDCASVTDVSTAMRRIHRARGVDAILFRVAGADWYRLERNGEPGDWTTLASDGNGGWAPLVSA